MLSIRSPRAALALATLLGALLGTTAAHAVSVSYAGTFTRDDELRVFAFYAPVAGAVTIETFSYAGGTNASGTAVAGGGFDPVFSLFDAAGSLLATADDGASRADPVSGNAFDARLVTTLPAGSYFVALSQFDHYALGPNFGNGFLETGNPTFTAAFGCSAGRFCDLTGSSRSANFDISISTPVPEPRTAASMLGGAAALLLLARRRRRTRAFDTTTPETSP